MRLWIMSQDGEKLVLAESFEVCSTMNGPIVCANGSVVGRYKSKARAREVLTEIEKQLRRGNCFDDMYQHRRVSKQNVYHMPED